MPATTCSAPAGIPKAEQADEIVRFVDFWQQHTGQPPAEWVFDSQLTTYATLNRLNQRGIRFLTLRRRSRRMLGQIGIGDRFRKAVEVVECGGR